MYSKLYFLHFTCKIQKTVYYYGDLFILLYFTTLYLQVILVLVGRLKLAILKVYSDSLLVGIINKYPRPGMTTS